MVGVLEVGKLVDEQVVADPVGQPGRPARDPNQAGREGAAAPAAALLGVGDRVPAQAAAEESGVEQAGSFRERPVAGPAAPDLALDPLAHPLGPHPPLGLGHGAGHAQLQHAVHQARLDGAVRGHRPVPLFASAQNPVAQWSALRSPAFARSMSGWRWSPRGAGIVRDFSAVQMSSKAADIAARSAGSKTASPLRYANIAVMRPPPGACGLKYSRDAWLLVGLIRADLTEQIQGWATCVLTPET